MKSKFLAVGAAVVVAGGLVGAGSVAGASDPATNSTWDVNKASSSLSGSTSGSFSSVSVQCDGPTHTLVGGGVELTNPVDGAPVNGNYFNVVSSHPVHSGSPSVKDMWTVYVRSEPGTNGRTFNFDVKAVCDETT